MEEDNKNSVITLEDFPFICRICCLRRNDLRPFEEVDCLIALFHTIMNIDVCSTVEYPKNVCDECASKLENISLLVNTSKDNDTKMKETWMTQKEMEENLTARTNENCEKDIIHNEESQVCRICLSKKCLTPFEEKKLLANLFIDLTELDSFFRSRGVAYATNVLTS
ncbi:uncharacterized protein isoform X2 [Leptinotarsa decemlineata]|uniref:uncharacterized protein isoform X2 n=1 Tax=Leptinotarsa decemlineata TaxID=7539 RepID=UPI003D30BA97